jgi:hypothetical protein
MGRTIEELADEAEAGYEARDLKVGKRQRRRLHREMCHPATQSARASAPKRKRKHGRR